MAVSFLGERKIQRKSELYSDLFRFDFVGSEKRWSIPQ